MSSPIGLASTHVQGRRNSGLTVGSWLLNQLLLLCVGFLAVACPATHAGSITREVYSNIGGNAISDLISSPNYPNAPSETSELTDFFEAPTDVAEAYGQRVRGYIVPPVTGDYTFWIASDDNGALYLSTDSNPANKQLIAQVTGWTSPRQWDVEAAQRSASIRLEASRAYYIEALMKEGGGGDNLAVRWLRPDGLDEGPIPATYLLSAKTLFTKPKFTQMPASLTAPEGTPATFSVVLAPEGPASLAWYRDGILIPNAVGSTYEIPAVSAADNGAKFKVIATNDQGVTESDIATLTVTGEIVPPTLVRAFNLGLTNLWVKFSESILPPPAPVGNHLKLDWGATVTAAVADTNDPTFLILTTSPLSYGTNYTLTVSQVKDTSTAGNVIAPGSKLVFQATQLAPRDVGTPVLGGSVVQVPGGLNVTGGGSDIGGRTDQFQFAWERRTGDFDIQTRVEGSSVADAFLHAGLMARESFDGNARFAAMFASSVQVGCFFESRSGLGASTITTSLPGGYPVNYPNTWLRLRRVGTTLDGFASLDGIQWTFIGTTTLADITNDLYVGLAVTSQNAQLAATARFRNYGPTVSTVEAPLVRDRDREPLAPSSRSTGIVFSEIHYHPRAGFGGSSPLSTLEFVEIYNAGAIVEDLTGYRVSGAVDYAFPNGFQLQAGAFAVIAAEPDAVKSAYGLSTVLGPYENRLDNKSGTIRLKNEVGAVLLEANYDSKHPWPASADGAGHSLVLARPSWGEGQREAWAASARIGGSPGEMDATIVSPLNAVVLNEILAHTDEPQLDFIELHNRSNEEIDLSGCVLTDDATTNRFRIPTGTKLAARSQVAFDQNRLGFRLDAAGETIYLLDPQGIRILDSLKFGAQENGVSYGRSPDGAPTWRRLSIPTPDSPNAAWKVEDVVINEIMFDPISGDSDDEYVELYNRSQAAVDLKGWRFTSGIDFAFPNTAKIAAGGYVVIAKNRTRLLANYPNLSPAIAFGDYAGSLGNSGDHVALAFPDQILHTNDVGELKTNTIHIVTAEVVYKAGGRWGRWSQGGGSSMELVDPDADPLRPSNWADSNESAKGTWQSFEYTGRAADAVTDANRFFVTMLGAGEVLVDDIEVISRGTNLLATAGTFENGKTGWTFFGTHSGSSIDTTGAASGTQCLHVRSVGDGDTGPNSIRTSLNGLAQGVNATLKAKARWIAGWPEMLLRVKGTPIEFPIRLAVPTNLGTPGAPNSRLVPNAGPAIFDVTHTPALPRVNEAVVVSARLSDPDGIASVTLRSRNDANDSVTTTAMKDDGTGGDAIAGDGVYSATISGKSSGTIIGFRIEATDAAATDANASKFPADAPARECLIRWGENIPFGTYGHYHMINTKAVEAQRTSSPALNNTYRDCTLIYNTYRVVYNAGFRDKGSPFHGGGGDYAVTVPEDDVLMGVSDRVFGSTGNGGSETTGLRGRVSAWIARKLGIPYLYAHPIRVWRNGSLHRNVSEDLEQPNNQYAERRFPDGSDGDLYKIAIWFEFDDNNSGFSSVQADLGQYKNPDGSYNLGRYRFNWQTRGFNGSANNYSNLFNLVRTANGAASSYVRNMTNAVDVDGWMRVFVFNRILGNWDSYGMGIGQNMFIYKQTGLPWRMIPWDIDFVLGDGNASNDSLWGGPDPAINRMFDNPTFRRMLWRAYQDAANGFLTTNQSNPQIDLRRDSLLNNGISSVSDPGAVKSYIAGRRRTILSNLASNDAKEFAITTSNGANFTSTTQTVTLEGTAKFEVVDIAVNGVVYPVEWIDFTKWRIKVALTAAVNDLVIQGRDRTGKFIDAARDTVTVRFNGTISDPANFVVINEIQYNSSAPGASYIEIYNSSATATFSLAGWRLEGVGYTFPDGAVLGPNSYLVLAKDRPGFELAYGAGIAVYDVFPGSLDNGGETLRLIKPGATPDLDQRISDVRFDDRLPWPVAADGLGSSLQLIDPASDSYRVGNWAADDPTLTRPYTPGGVNTVREALTPFPLLWLNEVQPINVSGPKDNLGEREPWIELYNAGTDPLDLSEFYLTDSFTNLTQWQFPAGTTLAAKSFLQLWADGEPGETTATALHTSFRLTTTNGAVALVRRQGAGQTPAVMDYIEFNQLPANQTIGSIPDGEPRSRRALFYATPAAPNNPDFPKIQVTLNEYMADNVSSIVDPADGKASDWFELYNAGEESVDLTGYSLTDNLLDPRQFVIPAGYVIPSNGFLLVWADGDTKQNVSTNIDLHVNFKLDALGESLGLFGPDGALVDGFKFGPQVADRSEGRVPDGEAPPFAVFDSPTPREPNIAAGANLPPILTPIGARSVVENTLLNFTPKATDPEGKALVWSVSVDAPAGLGIDASSGQITWTPTEEQGPGVYSFVVRVTDTGVPPRTAGERITVTVTESNRPPVLEALGTVTVPETTTYSLQIVANDPDLPANTLVYSLGAGAPEGATIDAATGVLTWTPTETQGPGQYTLQVKVADGGTPPLSDTKTLTLNVTEVDNAPVFSELSPQTATEGVLFTYTVRAVDPDSPPSTVFYSLDKAPQGASIDSNTGVIRWTPTEEQGPQSHIFVVRATENSGAHLSDARSFGVTVAEQNQAPVLQPIPDVLVKEGGRVDFTLTAADADLPVQSIVYTLVSGAPAGATLDPNTGRFEWNVPDDTVPGTNTVIVSAADNGPGTLSDKRSFRLIVEPRFRVVINEIMYRAKTAGAEYVELYNASAITPADLSGLLLATDNSNYTFPSGTVLAPKSFLTVVANPAIFRATYGDAPVIVGPWQGTLGGRGTVALYRETQGRLTELLRVTYDRTAPWPAAADGGGSSLQLIDAARDINRPGNWSANVPLAGPQTLVPFTQTWKYFQQGAAPAGWQAPEFADDAWPSGGGALYVENAAIPVPKTTALTLGKLAYYFRTTFVLPIVPTGATLSLSHVLDDGAVFYLNGRELLRSGMPDGAINYDTPSTVTVGDAALAGPFTVPADALKPGVNVLAVEVHQISSGSSDIVMATQLVLEGGTLPAFTPGAPNNVVTPLPEFPSLRINEVLAINTTGLKDASGTAEPWIELINDGDKPVDVAGLFLTDNPAVLNKWVFPSSHILQPGEFLVVFADNETSQNSPTEFHAGFRLPQTAGTTVKLVLSRLQSGVPATIDEFNVVIPPANASFTRFPDGDTATGTTSTLVTPGAPNDLVGANHKPVFDPIQVPPASAGVPWSLAVSAKDTDRPAQTLKYSLVVAPAGAVIQQTTGLIQWTPNASQLGFNRFVVQVRDSGIPSLQEDAEFQVYVSESSGVIEMSVGRTGESLRIAWPTAVGKVYRLEARAEAGQGDWVLINTYPGTGASLVVDIPMDGGARYYRIVQP